MEVTPHDVHDDHADSLSAPGHDELLERYRHYLSHTFTVTLNLAHVAQYAPDHRTREILQDSIADLDESGRMLRDVILPLLEQSESTAHTT